MNVNEVIAKGMAKRRINPNIKKVLKKILKFPALVVLSPLYGIVVVSDKINKKLNNKLVWSEEKAKEVLDRNIHRLYEECEEGIEINTRKIVWSYKYKEFYRKDRKWVSKFHYNLGKYLIEKYELEGCEKEYDNCFGGHYEGYVIFKIPVDK